MQGVRQRGPCRPRVLLENVSLISGQVLDAWVLAVMPRSLKMENRTSQCSTEGQRRLCCSRDVSEEAADVSTAASWHRLPADVLLGFWGTISAEALDVRLIRNSILALSHNPVLWAIEKDVKGGVAQMRARLTNVGSSAARTGGRVQSWQRCMGRRTTFLQQCVCKKGSTSQRPGLAHEMRPLSRCAATLGCSHKNRPQPSSTFGYTHSHAAAASRVLFMARCNRQTMSGGSFASGGSSTYNSRNTSPHRCVFFTSTKLIFNDRLFRDTLMVMASEIRKLTASRGGGCEEVRALLLCVVAFLHLLRHPIHLVLITL